MPTRQLATGRRDPLITGINITPLVDIVLVLLVVLMVVSTYIVTQSMRVDLPRLRMARHAHGALQVVDIAEHMAAMRHQASLFG